MRHLHRQSRSFKQLLSLNIKLCRSSGEEITKHGRSTSPSFYPDRKSIVEKTFDDKPHTIPTWRYFTYEEIYEATKGFHQDNLVGTGGYAEVFRGVLCDGRTVAVKRLTRASTEEQREKEFLTELGTVSHVSHPNVSPLLGFCIDRDLHLIFEFSPNGSLSSHLHNYKLPPMAWEQRHKVAIGAAKGLCYLHKGCQRRIIHRDIKASNILLTSDFEAQISDFGLARWLPSEWTHRAAAPIEGTFGCLAPEYFLHGIIDEKTDVFAFGVFLLEIITGKKPVDSSHNSLLSLAKPHLMDGTVEMLVDPRLGREYDMQQLKRLAFAALLCVNPTAVSRPSMPEVLELVEEEGIPAVCWREMEEKKKKDEVEEQFLWGFEELDLECESLLSSPTTLYK